MEEKKNHHDFKAELGSDLLNGINYTGNKGPCFGRRYIMILMMAFGSGLLMITNTCFSVIIVAMTTQNTTSNSDIPTYGWTNKGVILSSHMWLGIPIQLFVGPLERKYGLKWLVLIANVVNDVVFMLIPWVAQFGGSTGVIICRVIQGGASGMLNPLTAAFGGTWVPAEERSKAGMVAFGVVFLCATLGNLGAGQLVASSVGYPGCIYFFGSLNLVWCVLWTYVGQQRPATDQRITPEEKKYIETSLNSHKSKSTSVLGIAPIAGLLVGVIIAPLSDFLITKKYIRAVNSRRLFQTVGLFGNALCLLWMTWIPASASRGLMILNMCLNNAFVTTNSVGGSDLNILDIAPAFAGIISGFSSTFSACFALIAPITIDWIVKDESSVSEWRTVFLVSGVVVVVTTIFFDIFATDKRQWDIPKEEDDNKQ